MPQPFRLPDDPSRAGSDVEREIALHLELRAREFEAQGLTPEAARRAAAESFGDKQSVVDACQDLRTDTLRGRRRRERWSELVQDIRGALRGLRRSPGFTLIAILTLALGIGANAAIFTVVRWVVLAPLPYPESDRLVQLWTDERANGRSDPEWLTPPDFQDWRSQNRSFASMAAYQSWGPDLTGDGDPESLGGASVTADYFRVLGVSPALGRDFSAAEDHPGAERVILLSDGIWRRRFGGDSTIIGRSLTLNGEGWTVIGVLGRDFRPPFAANPDVWRLQRRAPGAGCGRGCIVLRAIGRLRPGVTLAQAHQDLSGVAGQLEQQYPETNRGRKVWLVPLHEQLTSTSRDALLALSAAVGLVLLIACVNIANLLLVRGSGRSRELAVRGALGAGRGRLIRQLVTESLVLASIGGGLGLAIAVAMRSGMTALVPAAAREMVSLRLDPAVVGFTIGLSLLAGVLFGLVPAFRAVARQPMMSLRLVARSDSAGDGRLRNGLVVGELSLAVILLIGAGLLLQSFIRLQRVDLGYRTDGLVTASAFFPPARYPDRAQAAVRVESLLERLRANPAVRAVEVTDQPPLSAGDQDMGAFPIGEPPLDAGTSPSLWYRAVSPGYAELMQMRLVRGRYFETSDRAGAPLVGLINEEAARRFWRGKDPIGRVVADSPDSGAMRVTIIGILANTRTDGPGAPFKPELFVPMGQQPSRGATVIMDPAGSDRAALDAFRIALREVDALLPFSASSSFEAAADRVVALPKAFATFVGGFAGLALLLAAIGVYGVMAYSVTQRQREIGVRVALGAKSADIRGMVLRQGGRLAAIGTAVGLLGAAVTTRMIRSQLFGIGPMDPLTFIGVPLVLVAVAMLAAWIPARRATRIDPLVAMRAE